MKHIFKYSLKIPDIFLLWCGQGISSLFSSIYAFALSWYVIDMTGSSLQMGLILLIAMIPKIFFSIYSGVLGDRVNKKKYLISLNFLRFTATILWSLLLFYREITLLEIYAFTLLLSSVDAFFNPVYSALITELINETHLTRAASFNQMINKIALMLAPTIASILIIYFDLKGFIAINAFGFLIAGVLTFCIQSIKSKVYIQGKDITQDFKNGMLYFYDNKSVFWSVILITIANISVVSYNVNLAKYINHSLHLDAKVYGMTLTSFSLGSLVSLALMTALNLTRYRGKMYMWSLLTGGILFLFIPYGNSPVILNIIFFFIGLLFSVTSTISTTILFDIKETEYRSRILGIASISSLLSPIGLIIWGIIGDTISSGWAMGMAGVLIISTAIGGIFTRLYRYD